MPLVAIWMPSGIYIGISGIALYKLPSGTYILTHKHREDMVCLGGVLNVDLLEQTVLRIHRGVPKLFRIHLAETFVALGSDVLFQTSSILVDEALPLDIIVAIFLHLALGAEV